MDTRRQSGLWRQNDASGHYERESPSANPGPFEYYKPPTRTSTSDRRSFAERAGGTSSSLDDDSLASAVDSATVKMNTRAALMTHEDILSSPEHTELVKQLHEHEAGGAADSDHFAKTGHFTDSFPAAMAVGMGATDSAHFSRTRHASEAGLEDVPGNVYAAEPEEDARLAHIGATGLESLGKTQHINETELPDSSVQPPITAHAMGGDDAPENLRTQPWSPEPDDATEHRAEASGPPAGMPVRRASVPDRSPLQKLQRESSKEEKRARLQEAENRAIQRQGTLRSEKGRVVSDGSRRPSESTSDKYYQSSPRQVSAGSETLGGLPPVGRSQRESESWRNSTRVAGVPAVARDPRPYHHAPPVPGSLDSTRNRDVSTSGGPAIARNPRPYHHAPAVPRSLDSRRRATGMEESRAIPQTGFSPPPIVKNPRPYHHAPAAPRSLAALQKFNRNEQRRSYDQQRASMDAFQVAPISREARPYHHAPAEPRSLAAMRNASGNGQRQSFDQQGASIDAPRGTNDVHRSPSGVYRHRLRDAGYAGAAAAATAGAGAIAYEATSGRDEVASGSRQSTDLNRSGSKKLQKVNRKSTDAQQDYAVKQSLQSDRIGGGTSVSMRDRIARHMQDQPDPISREQVKTAHGDPLAYRVPPQTAAGQAARELVGFDATGDSGPRQQQYGEHHRFRDFLHHGQPESRGYQPAKPLDEWRGVAPVMLAVADLEFDDERQNATAGSGDVNDTVWWERNRNSQRSSNSAQQQSMPAQHDGAFEEKAGLFQPPLYLKCGPLLRYTGMRREGEREIWRGSVLIVTEDESSDLSSVPTLRLFAQSMDLHQMDPRHLLESAQIPSSEHEDPVAGQVKVSRTGRPLYVRPVDDIEAGVDLSQRENNSGLYSAQKTPMLGTQTSTGADGRESRHIAFQDKSRIKGWDGEKAGRYKEVKAVRLHTERGFTFWRWSLEIELGSRQHRVAYRINRGPALGFWVPARGETMNVMFHSCNGFSLSVDADQFSGPDPLWRDVLNKHQSKPFHVMVGGGDQVYNDAAMRDTTLFREWLQTKNPEHKHGADFSAEMQDELEDFFLKRYSMWFSQGLFAMAGSQIPMVNIWDDHDIIDGYGSYPHHFMSTRVFTGLGAIAFKYYMLFQHQSVPAETAETEPSWLLGSGPGPYINEPSRHIFVDFGRKVKFLGLDCRTERMRDEVLSEATYDIIFDRCRAEIQSGETRHLIVLMGVPIAYPRLNFLENILTSRMMDPIKAIGRAGMLGGFVNKFDGGVEVLDDLDDHWASKGHKSERNWLIQELQELAAEKSVRITILGGDVHLGAVGQFYTPKKLGISKDRDHRYMPNVISSAIVNTPPPVMLADVLNRRNKVHHLDAETDEDMIPMFEVDVDGSQRNNKCLLPRRNYCTIREFQPGHTPPPTPPPERNMPFSQGEYGAERADFEDNERRYPPGSMASRTRSLTRGPANLIRRLSGSRRQTSLSNTSGLGRSQSLDEQRPQPPTDETSFDGPRRPSFHRRPTNLTEKDIKRAAAKGGAPDEEGAADGREPGHIDLEYGLDITLNMEIDQHDPLGATQSYRLLVPALWYSGAPDVNDARFKSRRGTILDRFRSRGKRAGDDDMSRSSSPPPDDGAPINGRQNETGFAGSAAPNDTYGHGADGAQDARNGSDSRQMDHTASAYGKGYNLSAPPIGSGQVAQQPAVYNNPYPQSGYRPAPNVPTYENRGGQHGAHGRDPDAYSEGSFTSDEYVDAPSRPQRRLSKAERFFGVGQGGNGTRDSMQDDGAFATSPTQKKKANWMIWR